MRMADEGTLDLDAVVEAVKLRLVAHRAEARHDPNHQPQVVDDGTNVEEHRT